MYVDFERFTVDFTIIGRICFNNITTGSPSSIIEWTIEIKTRVQQLAAMAYIWGKRPFSKERHGVMASRITGYLCVQPFVQANVKVAKPAFVALCEENPPVTDGFPLKGPVTQKAIPFHSAIMNANGAEINIFPRCHMSHLSIPTFPSMFSNIAGGYEIWNV